MKKTTLELPDALTHRVKLRAVHRAHKQALEAAMKWKLVTEDSKLRNAVPSWTVSLSDALS